MLGGPLMRTQALARQLGAVRSGQHLHTHVRLSACSALDILQNIYILTGCLKGGGLSLDVLA